MGDENGCANGCSFTYGSEAAAHGRLSTDCGFTMGGYCKSITANRHFTCKVTCYIYLFVVINPVNTWSADSRELSAEVGGTRLLRRHHHVLPAEGLGRPRGRAQRRHRRHRGTWTGEKHSFNQSLKRKRCLLTSPSLPVLRWGSVWRRPWATRLLPFRRTRARGRWRSRRAPSTSLSRRYFLLGAMKVVVSKS